VVSVAVTGALSVHAGSTRPASLPQQPDDIRGLWVLRTSLTSPESIAAMVRSASQGGFNTLLVQVRGRGEAFYRSDIEPRASDLDRQPASFDPLATVLAQARDAGLRVHAWVNVNLVASGATLPRSRDHVAIKHPEWLMAPRPLAATLAATSPRSPAFVGSLARWTRAEAERVEGLYLSPVLPAAREYTTGLIRELLTRYDLDGVHLDYIRYPGPEFDYSPAALAEFRAMQAPRATPAVAAQVDRAARTNPAAWTEMFPETWTAFRHERLGQLVRSLERAARAARPGVTVSAAVVPGIAEARDQRLQDWQAWTRAGLLDVVCPMIYTTDAAEFAAAVAALSDALGETPFWAGIGAYRMPIAGTIAHVRLARRGGADGVLLFSYDKLTDAGTNPSSFTALRPVLRAAAPRSGGTR
jgi:uncharacterized lipoprotein YddW (UPF0748 family)